MSSRIRFERLKALSLRGDTAATCDILDAFRNHTLSFNDIVPVISHHLSEARFALCLSESAALDDWPSLPTTANVRTCLKILTFVCDDRINMFDLPSSLESFIGPLIPLYTKWIVLFLEWTGVLQDVPHLRADPSISDILFEMSSVAQAISLSAALRRIVAAENIIFPMMLKIWLYLCDINHPEKMVVQGMIFMGSMIDTDPERERVEEGSMFACMNTVAPEVAKALLKCLFDDVFLKETLSLHSLTTSLSIMEYYTDPSGVFRRTLIANGISRVLCHAARRITKNQSDGNNIAHCLSLLGSQLSLCSWTAQTVSDALRSHIVVTLLRMEVLCTSVRHDAPEWTRHAAVTFTSLTPFLMYRSLFGVFLKAIRQVEGKGLEGLLDPRGPVRLGYLVFKRGVESRRLALQRYSESTGLERLSICVNPKCTLETARVRASRCSGCQFALYCSVACQRDHWNSGHREECPRLASASRIGFPPPPPCPQDMHYIFFELERDLNRNMPTILRQIEEFKATQATRHIGRDRYGDEMVVLRMGYGANPPIPELGVRLSVSSLDDLRLEVGPVEGYATAAAWEKRVSCATGPRDVYVALMISGRLVHLTNMQNIKNRVYPVHVEF